MGSCMPSSEDVQSNTTFHERLFMKERRKERHVCEIHGHSHVTWTTPLRPFCHYKIAVICFHAVSGTAPPYLSELRHLSSPLSLHSASLWYSVFLGWAGGPWERGPFNTLDLWSGTLFLSLLCQAFVFTLLSQNGKAHLSCSVYWSVLSRLLILPTHHQ